MIFSTLFYVTFSADATDFFFAYKNIKKLPSKVAKHRLSWAVFSSANQPKSQIP